MTDSARFEFRTWSRNFAVVEDRIRRLSSCKDILESAEIYFVAPRMSACNVKIRGGAVDTKALIDTRDGLEQWQPECNMQFPLTADSLKQHVFVPLCEEPPELERPAYSEQATVEEVLRPHPNIAMAMLFKRRFSFSIRDCMVEWTQAVINDASLESVAIESLDPEKVTEVRLELGLADFRNVSYPRLLQHVIGMTPLQGGFQEGG